jgi:hypothetical protein
METKYTCVGSVCGGCDVQHRTIAAAVRCCDRHQAAIARNNCGNAYSDRTPVRVDGLQLTEWEVDQVYRCRED